MTIVKRGDLYYASVTVDGKVFMGYSPIRKEAIEFTCGLIQESLA